MKLSVEAKVAAAVAAGFVALSIGAIAQAGSGRQSAESNNYISTSSGLNTRANPEVDNNSLLDGIETEGNQTATDQDLRADR